MRIATGLDLETSGLLTPEHRIVELAVIAYDLGTGRKLSKLVRRFNPGRPIDAKATEVHHITFEDVSLCPRLEDDPAGLDLVDRLLLHSTIVFAHNGIGFDFPFMSQEWTRIGRALPVFKRFDTMLEARWATPLGKYPTLQELCFACRIPYDPALAHAAEYDVDKMAECFFFALKRGFYSVPSIQLLKEAA